uniref:Mitochondrial import inner membrane translocase subunit TIM50 n=1 Tax=Coccolithus braarudii TaxID=221442 RepID=A0A7S0L5B2_9EUKA
MLRLARSALFRRGATAALAATSGALLGTSSSSADGADAPRASTETAAVEAGVFSRVQSSVADAHEYVSTQVYDTFIKPYAEPSRDKLLPNLPTHATPKPILVLSLDGCLIESLWTRQHGWRYIKRPGLDQFLESLFPYFEIVLWTDSMNTADPIVDRFDPRRRIRHRLYRDTTTFSNGHHRKDLSVLNRDPKKVVMIETEPETISFQPANGIIIPKYDHTADPDKEDKALTKLILFLQYCSLTGVSDIPAELAQYAGKDIGDEFEKKLPELRAQGKLRALLRQRAGGIAERPAGSTLWDRLRSR